MEISASLVKELRDKTEAGMMDCKKALIESKGDLEKAIDWLRKKGVVSAASKSGRIAAEGLIGIYNNNNGLASLVEVNSETDFVSRNKDFQEFVRNIAVTALKVNSDHASLLSSKYDDSNFTIEQKQADMISKIGENIVVRRSCNVSVKNGIVASYLHNSVSEDLGKIGVLVGIKAEKNTIDVGNIGKKIAMHIAASKPEVLDIKRLRKERVLRERNILTEQAEASGKPEPVIQKIVDGRIKKFYEEVVLLEQPWVMDTDMRVKDFLKLCSTELNMEITIEDFKFFVLGQGLENQ